MRMSEIPEAPPVNISVPIPGDLLTRLDAIARRDLTSRAQVARLAMLRFADAELPLEAHTEETEKVRDMEREPGVSSREVLDEVAGTDAKRAKAAKKAGARG
jgi:predicted transcriptional regulator